MPECTGCRRAVSASEDTIRGPAGPYHMGCAPNSLVEAAAEEHAAIVRKGVRYFVEKYDGFPSATTDWGPRFVALGTALQRERSSRVSR
jgi:hypothetical protein